MAFLPDTLLRGNETYLNIAHIFAIQIRALIIRGNAKSISIETQRVDVLNAFAVCPAHLELMPDFSVKVLPVLSFVGADDPCPQYDRNPRRV
jgi:hypothetical protein